VKPPGITPRKKKNGASPNTTPGLGATHCPQKPLKIEHPAAAVMATGNPMAAGNPTDTTNGSPLSMNGSSLLGHHPPNIAPQHMFDDATLVGNNFTAASLSGLAEYARAASPASDVSVTDGPDDDLNTLKAKYATIKSKYNLKKTRLKEQEVVNGLFHGRVNELELSESSLRAQVDQANQREIELKNRIEELTSEINELREIDGPERKRMRFSDMVAHSRASTPASTASKTVI
jgi:GATA-binding protein